MSKKVNLDRLEAYIMGDIAAKVRASFVILLSNCAEFWGEGYWNSVLVETDDLRNVRTDILNDIARLEDIFNLDGDEAAEYIRGLRKHKETVSYAWRTLQAYIEKLQFLSGCADRALDAAPHGEGREPLYDKARILADCKGFVADALNEAGQKYRRSLILGCFPVRMTGGLFGDYVRAGICSVFAYDAAMDTREADEYLEHLKEQLKPESCPGYGVLFPSVAADIEALNVFGHQTEEAVAEICDNIEAQVDELTLVADYLLLLFECANSLMILCLFSLKIDTLLGDSFALRDAYNTITENILSPEKEAFGEAVNEILADCLDETMDTVASCNEKCVRLLEKPHDGGYPEELENMLQYRAMVTTLFYEAIDEYEADNEKKPVRALSEDDAGLYVENSIEGFISFMDGVLSKEPPNMRRLMRQHFISALMCPLDDKAFGTYVAQELDNAEKSSNLTPIVTRLAAVFNAAGFETETV